MSDSEIVQLSQTPDRIKFEMGELTPEQTPEVLFTRDEVLDAVLQSIEERALECASDTSTARGRKEITSTAYKVVRSKTFLDEIGKTYIDDIRAKVKDVDSRRKRVRDSLDALAERIKKPLLDWEAAERVRVKAHQDALEVIRMIGFSLKRLTSVEISDRIKAISELPSREYEEFAGEAISLIASTNQALAEALGDAQNREAEVAREAAQREEDRRKRIELENELAEKNRKFAELEAQKKAAELEAQRKLDELEAQKKAAELEAQRNLQAVIQRDEPAVSSVNPSFDCIGEVAQVWRDADPVPGQDSIESLMYEAVPLLREAVGLIGHGELKRRITSVLDRFDKVAHATANS